MTGMTTLQIVASIYDADELIEALRTLGKVNPGVADGCEDHYALGTLAAYVAWNNRERQLDADLAAEKADAEIAELSEAQIDELIVNVSTAKLRKLLDERRLEMADVRLCAFPPCPNDCEGDSLFCADHIQAYDGDEL